MAYVLRIFLARTYVVEEYGLIYAMISFFSFIVIFVDLGLSQSVLKTASNLRSKNNEQGIKTLFFTVFIFQLIVTIVIGLVLLFFSSFISENFFHSSNSILFQLMLLWFASLPLYFMIINYLLAYQKTTWWAFLEFLRLGILFCMIFVLQKFGFGIKSVFVSYAIINIVLFSIFFVIFKKFFLTIKSVTNFTILPSILKYGFFVSVGSFGWIILTQTDTLILTYFRGLVDVGLYQAAIPIASILLTILSPITMVFFSNIANLWAKNKTKDVKYLYGLLNKYVLIFILPLTFSILFFSESMLKLFFGYEYMPASRTLMILSVAFMFYGLSMINYTILSSIGRAKVVAKTIIFAVIFNFILSIFMVQYYGMIGVALSTLLTNIFIFLKLSDETNKTLDTNASLGLWFKLLFSALITLGIMFVLKSIININYIFEIVIISLIALVCYILLLFGLKIIDYKKELAFIKKIISSKF
jgi:O-antigen/teichoic acid export membrane protein